MSVCDNVYMHTCGLSKLILTLDSTLNASQSVWLVSMETLQTDHPGRFSMCSTSQVAMFVLSI